MADSLRLPPIADAPSARARMREHAAQARAVAAIARTGGYDVRDMERAAALYERLAADDLPVAEREAIASELGLQIGSAEASLARADDEARAAREHADRARAAYESTCERARSVAALLVAQRDCLAALVAALPADHPQQGRARVALREHEAAIRDAEEMVRRVDEQARIIQERDAKDAAIRASVDAAAAAPPPVRVRALVDARRQYQELRRRWSIEDRREQSRQRRARGRATPAVRRSLGYARRAPRAAPRRRAHRLPRAPAASDGDGPPTHRLARTVGAGGAL